MADENLPGEDTIPDDFGTPKSKGPSIVVLLVFALAGAGAGGWFGGPLLTPVVADLLASSPGGGGGHGAADDGHGGGGGGDDEAGPLTIEGLILNPANSGGSRFLIASLVLDTDADTRAEIEGRDAEVRDLLLTILSSKTVNELSDISNRDVIRQDLLAALNTMLGYEGVHRIFFPQFVIQ